MNRILSRMAVLTWMLVFTAELFGQNRSTIILYNQDKTKDSKATLKIYRAEDEQVVGLKFIATAPRIDGREGEYDAGILPGFNELWVRINNAAEAAPIRRDNGAWPSKLYITKSPVVSQGPPFGRYDRYTCVLTRYSECLVEGGTCRRGIWKWIPNELVVLTPVQIPTDLASGCETCYHEEEETPVSKYANRKPQSRVVKRIPLPEGK